MVVIRNGAKNNNKCGEIEIDFGELWVELKKYALQIGCFSVAFFVAALIYVCALAKPVYSYTSLVRIPPINGLQMNSFVEICKADVLNERMWGSTPVAKLTFAELIRGTSLIKLSFEGNSEVDVAKVDKEYTGKVLNRINDVIVKQEEQKFSREVINMIQNDVNYIGQKLNERNYTSKDVKGTLERLIQRLETKEKSKIFLKAELAQEPFTPEKPIRPQKVKNCCFGKPSGFSYWLRLCNN